MRALLLCLVALFVVLVPHATLAQEAAPRLSVVLVLDASGSMAGNDPEKLVAVAAKMLSDLTDERDRVTVLSFGSEVKKLAAERGSEHDALRAAIDTLGRSEACTDYAKALESAAGILTDKPAPGERRVVLFLTDGRFEPVEPNGTCGRFEGAPLADRQPIEERINRAVATFKGQGARVFTIGLGSAPTQPDSGRMLNLVASGSGGRFFNAKKPRDVPRIFATIFGALVGAPVMQLAVDAGHPEERFSVPKGADRLHVVLVPETPEDLEKVTLGHAGANVAFDPVRREGRTRSSYRVARVVGDAAGAYELRYGGKARLEILVIPDVGLSLVLEGLPALLAEGESFNGQVALRTRLGDAVKLAPEFVEPMTFTVTMNDAKLVEARPDAGVAAKLAGKDLRRGRYRIRASLVHGLGLLDVPAVEHTIAVEPRFSMKIEGTTVAFDTMAEAEAVPLSEPVIVRLTAPPELPIAIPLEVKLPDDIAADMRVEPLSFTVGPGEPREVTLKFEWRDVRSLRGKSHHYKTAITIVPKEDPGSVMIGERKWSVAVDGKLREWTWRRWLEEYKWEIVAGLCLLLVLIWVVGRVMAQTFPEKARIHYVEVGQEFASDSLIKRFARHGAYRHARFSFPLGKKARPLVTFQAKDGRFLVTPQPSLVILDDALPESDRERRKPFLGAWDQRYRLGDSYEVWLTRAGNPES
jgi:Mg-chelatase subunit ChlD